MSAPDEGGATHYLFLAKDWGERAEENVERWGNQSVATTFLALVEEIGEVAIELESKAGPGGGLPPNAVDYDQPEVVGRELIGEMANLGRETREFLEENFEEPAGKPKPESEREEVRSDIIGDVRDVDAVQDEVDDAAPLLFQLTWALQDERDRE